MLVMTAVSFTNLLGFNIAGITIIIGIAFFFINSKLEKNISADNGLNAKAIGTSLKTKTIYFWIVLPLILNVVCIVLAKLILPEYIEHLYGRTEFVVSLDKIMFLFLQLAILALGEEIAWRAFFQKQLSKALPIIPTLIVTSIIFAFGHIVEGSLIVVAYDIFFIFINSVLYGVIFYKTNNAWISATSHFIANLFSIILISCLLG
ncbi:CPBP family intramembrane metalloprotease [Psychrobacillus sp. NEAU-3TGS]|uniref:CPBP family intramembrane glutamic endopeptidase n=1 Tax=Psychrobacillus sp. NEAU-3TGS TaxID=2995412 RepID=UPI00249650A3|nr:CPBP family intramembrane glutamic endopeptidase [Psychrobacillus sp. NEAU-3TGS]MDI2588637.1 CPBP family intramembrane metalloprotease [Psychrobacillus sp. NEAU-3TGS]